MRVLESHRKAREEQAAAVPLMEVWELAQGEVHAAPAQWFAELFVSGPDADAVAPTAAPCWAARAIFVFSRPISRCFRLKWWKNVWPSVKARRSAKP